MRIAFLETGKTDEMNIILDDALLLLPRDILHLQAEGDVVLNRDPMEQDLNGEARTAKTKHISDTIASI